MCYQSTIGIIYVEIGTTKLTIGISVVIFNTQTVL